MFHFTSDFINSADVKLHYYRTGGEKPALVLAHGITDDGLCWLPVAEALFDSFDVIMVDLRGHGLSEAPESGYTMENLARELAGLILGLGIQKPFVLGHSMGAATTLILAALYPDLPRAILLEDPPVIWRRDEQEKSANFRNSLGEWIDANKRKTHGDLLAECSKSGWPENEIEPWINSKHRYSPRIRAFLDTREHDGVDLQALLRQITCPALFIGGDQARGAICGEPDITELKTIIPRLQSVPIAGAGHNIRRDQFATYMKAVKEFLTRH